MRKILCFYELKSSLSHVIYGAKPLPHPPHFSGESNVTLRALREFKVLFLLNVDKDQKKFMFTEYKFILILVLILIRARKWEFFPSNCRHFLAVFSKICTERQVGVPPPFGLGPPE